MVLPTKVYKNPRNLISEFQKEQYERLVKVWTTIKSTTGTLLRAKILHNTNQRERQQEKRKEEKLCKSHFDCDKKRMIIIQRQPARSHKNGFI